MSVKDEIEERVKDGVERVTTPVRMAIDETEDITETTGFRLATLAVLVVVMVYGLMHVPIDISSPRRTLETLVNAYHYTWDWAFSPFGEDLGFIMAWVAKLAFVAIFSHVWLKPLSEWWFWNKVLALIGVFAIIYVLVLTLWKFVP